MHIQKSDESACLSRTTGLIVGLLVILLPGISRAASDITNEELKLLPRYCQDTMSFPKNYEARANYWIGIMGRSFSHMHHYCWALNTVYRARKYGVPSQRRIGMWESAVGDYGYVITNAQADFILLPEIYTRLGEVELLLANPEKANKAFARARDLKPDYWPAYSHWAEYLISNAQRAEAQKIVISGLRYAPDAKVLREQYRILGGKPSDIPPKPVERSPERPLPSTQEESIQPDKSESTDAGAAAEESSSPKNP